MKTKILLLAIILMGCSKEQLEVTLIRQSTLSFRMKAPEQDLTSKIPDCKDGTPERVVYTLRNSSDQEVIYSSAVTQENGAYISLEDVEIQQGVYTLTDLSLVADGQLLYSVPNNDDGTELLYADLILPIQIDLREDTVVSGKVFCNLPVPERNLDIILETRGIYEEELTSLFFWVQRGEGYFTDCIDHIAFRIETAPESNDFIEFSIPVADSEEELYRVAIPEGHGYVYAGAIDVDGNEIQQPFAIRYYVPTMTLGFSYVCAPDEYFD